MILYTIVGVSDLNRAIAFYTPVFATLDMARMSEGDGEWAGWGLDYDHGTCFCIGSPFDRAAPQPGNGTMIAFRAADVAAVQAFHAAALANGGSDEGAPGTRPYYSPSFYVAYVRDPDRNKLAAVFHRYQPPPA